MKGSRWKNLLNTVIFLCVCAGFLMAYNRLTLEKKDFGINQVHNFYQMPRDSLDVIFLGSSVVYCDYSPKLLEDEYGLTAYDLAAASQDIWTSYYMLREALKYQSPQLIVVDMTDIYWEDEWSAEDDVVQSLYGMRPSLNKLGLLYASIPVQKWGEYIPSFIRCRGKEITKDDISSMAGAFVSPGNIYNGHLDIFETGDASEHRDIDFNDCPPIYFTEKRETYLRKILELCEEKGQNVLVVNSLRGNYSKKSFRSSLRVAEILSEYNVKGVDFNLPEYSGIIDWENDMTEDNVHLNASGSIKATRLMGDYIIQNFDIRRSK